MNLTKKQLDALKEVGNIGCGNAASALAEFLGRRITMSVPLASLVSLAEVPNKVGGKDALVACIMLKLIGGLSGRFLFVIPEKTSLKILRKLIPNSRAEDLFNLEELEDSCLKEICNILGGAFSNALSILTKTPVINSLPVMSFDRVGRLVENVVSDMKTISEEVLMIETSFLEEEEDLRFHIFLLPASLESLFEKIGVGIYD